MKPTSAAKPMLMLLVLYFSFLGSALGQAGAPRLAEQATDILEKRCVVCHGCYDAPCQLKLEAQAGLERGANTEKVYNGGRLRTAQLTRLFDDGFTERQWRKKGFFPVLDKENPQLGVMHQMLELKQDNPLPPTGALADEFDFSLNRQQTCPKQEEFESYANKFPLGGMPYGLPGLNAVEHGLVTTWLQQGAPVPALSPLGEATVSMMEQWEAFLNGDSKKERLMARYVYEHLFLAGLYLVDEESPTWFRLVRSLTPPGKPIELIATRRPYDDPGTNPFFYRLQRMPVTILEKRHMPYHFGQQRMNWYRELFLEPEYTVGELPGYETAIASNPFQSFRELPVMSRYRFLLEEAQFSIMNFIKGPVCRGQIALSVIDDHFWVVFVSPENISPELDANFLAKESDNLRLPTASTGTAIDVLAWRRYSKAQKRYSQATADYIQQELDFAQRNLDLQDIWDGNGKNDNASLTIFRHYDTASVVKGMVGHTPKTAWVISYPILERIHYLLVAGFDVYGNVSHQLESRLYMDFLRMESEFNFLMFMPPEKRKEIREFWYRDARASVKDHFFEKSELYQRPTDIAFKTDEPKTELLQQLRKKLHGAEAAPYTHNNPHFARLERNPGTHNSFLPEVSFINVFGTDRDEVYTILRNSGYSNIAQPFMDQSRRLTDEDTVTVVKGFIGAYPNSFLQINEKQLPEFVETVADLKSPKDYERLLDRYGVRRNSPWFWRFSDKLHEIHQASGPEKAGLFDYNRYQHHQATTP